MIATIWFAVFGCFCSLSDRRSVTPPGGGVCAWWAGGGVCAGSPGGGGLNAGATGAAPGMVELRALKTNWRRLMRGAASMGFRRSRIVVLACDPLSSLLYHQITALP